MSAETTCQVRVYSGGYRDMVGHVCGRPIVDEDSGLCKLHLRARERRIAKHAQEKAKRRESLGRRATAQGFVDRLARLGVRATVTYSTQTGEYTGGIQLTNPDQLEAVTRILEQSPELRP